ncbi:hypothetical protein MTBUT4_70148 [Magnetospirillum sp. UT-4]|nr:hypothetical protein MTBUT4_70148 [Magnetospirillum sp. UT-4]
MPRLGLFVHFRDRGRPFGLRIPSPSTRTGIPLHRTCINKKCGLRGIFIYALHVLFQIFFVGCLDFLYAYLS